MPRPKRKSGRGRRRLLTPVDKEKLSNLGAPKIRLKKGQRWVWLKTYGGFCTPTVMNPNGQLVETDGGAEYPGHILHAARCGSCEHKHWDATEEAVALLITRCLSQIK